MRFLITIALIMGVSNVGAKEYNLGIRRTTTEVAGVEVSVRVFYPTFENAIDTKFGPWKLSAAKNSEPASGSFPLIVISHGLGGNDWNHHLLAQQLVANGFVVAAVRHPDDLKRIGSQAILVLRPLELKSAITHLLNDDDLEKVINSDRIGAFGFSQGGLTVLRSLGAVADHQKLIEHCQFQKQTDEEFCTGKSFGLWQRLRFLWNKLTYDVPNFDPNQNVVDERIKVAIIAAPVGASITDLSSIKGTLWIMRAGADNVLQFPFHADAIHKSLSIPHTYTVYKGVEHYAFLSPFPESIKSEVGLPATDPEGFDRTKFLSEINKVIVEYFHNNLVLQ